MDDKSDGDSGTTRTGYSALDEQDIEAPRWLEVLFLGFFTAAILILFVVEIVYLALGYITGVQFVVDVVATTVVAIILFVTLYFIVRNAVRKSLKAEESLRSEKAFTDSVLNSLPDIFFVLDLEGNLILWNKSLSEVSGYSDEEIAGMKPVDFLVPEDRARGEESIDSLAMILEVTTLTKDGRQIPYEFHGSPLYDHRGEYTGLCGIGRDITERKRAEEEIQGYREHLEDLVDERTAELRKLGTAVEQSRDGVAITDLDGNFQFANTSLARMHMLNVEDFDGKHVRLIHTKEQFKDEVLPFSEEIMKEGSSQGEIWHVRSDGITFPTWMTGTLLKDKRGKPFGIVATVRDITQQKRAEAELRLAEEKYRGIVENAVEGVFQSTPEGRFITVNPALARMMGYDSPHEMIAAVKDIAETYVQPSRREELKELLNKYGTVQGFEAQVLRKDRSKFWVIINAHAVRDQRGEISYYEGMAVDITERKIAEEELQGVISELEGYAHAVSHDIRGPLSVVIGANQTLKHLVESSAEEITPEILEVVELIDKNVEKAHILTEDLLALAEVGQVPKGLSLVDIGSVVDQVLVEWAEEISEKGIEVTVDEDLGELRANPTHMYQLFSNLIVNAILHNDSSDPVMEVRYHGKDGGGASRYLVRDNGAGIPDDEVDKIFDLLFKGSSEGTGIGLTIVEKVIKAYDGEIRAYNDEGACFSFSLKDAQLSE